MLRRRRGPLIGFVVVDYKYSLRGLAHGSADYRDKLSEVHLRSAKKILKLCEANRGFYVKAGQFVSSIRQVPKEYSSTLSCLQDQATPCNFQDIKIVIEQKLGKDLHSIFLEFDEHPIAAASIAQVQYPGLERRMKIDIMTMSFLSKSLSWIFPDYRFEKLLTEFERTMSMELDFIQEAKNSERTASCFRKNNVVKELTSKEVLTMEFCSGYKVDNFNSLRKADISPTKLWKALILLDSQKILELGEHFGVGKYAKYFPVIFTGRTIESKSILGTQMSIEEKMRLKQDLNSLGMDDISSFMESLPPDFLTILRTDGLLRSILGNLGAPRHVRLLTYAKCALYGLEEQPKSQSELAGFLMQINDLRHKIMSRFRRILQNTS
uniref:ABC1 atypical kinase-like domain-containing protein n=1 Tax=Oryza glumipatula TaxID=40148 RepID=A0A0E0BK45_9ORYZ